jgi:hypothetical protein
LKILNTKTRVGGVAQHIGPKFKPQYHKKKKKKEREREKMAFCKKEQESTEGFNTGYSTWALLTLLPFWPDNSLMHDAVFKNVEHLAAFLSLYILMSFQL